MILMMMMMMMMIVKPVMSAVTFEDACALAPPLFSSQGGWEWLSLAVKGNRVVGAIFYLYGKGSFRTGLLWRFFIRTGSGVRVSGRPGRGRFTDDDDDDDDDDVGDNDDDETDARWKNSRVKDWINHCSMLLKHKSGSKRP